MKPLTVLFMLIAYAYGEIAMQASEFQMCDNKSYAYHLHNVKLRIKDDAQEIKMKVVLGSDVDDDNSYVISVDRYIGTKMKRILNLKNKGSCSALLSYGGDTFMGGVKKAKFPHPDKCPLEKGTYHLDWYKINFDAIPLVKLVPKGKFKLNVQIFDMKGVKELLCVNLVIDKK